MIWLGNEVQSVYLGDKEVQSVYLGSSLIWKKGTVYSKSTGYISVQVPLADTTLSVSVSAEALESASRVLYSFFSKPNPQDSAPAKSILDMPIKFVATGYSKYIKLGDIAAGFKVQVSQATPVPDPSNPVASSWVEVLQILAQSVSDPSAPIESNISSDLQIQSSMVSDPSVRSRATNEEKMSSSGSALEKVPTLTGVSHVVATPDTELVQGDSIVPLLGENVTEFNAQETAIGNSGASVSIDDTALSIPLGIVADAELYPDESYDSRAIAYINGTIKTIYAEDWGDEPISQEYLFYEDTSVEEVYFPDNWTGMPPQFFVNPKEGVSTVVHFTPTMTNINTSSGFNTGNGRFTMDFTQYTQIPTTNLSSSNWSGVSKIVVPSALLSDWKAAAGWKNAASKIVAG